VRDQSLGEQLFYKSHRVRTDPGASWNRYRKADRQRANRAVTLDFIPCEKIEVPMMRLTLRTLLAWLDDTLQPTQVREIGSQVAESPFAQELTERIQRVTRQRRLTVPSSSGPDPTDPNVVASYLDNDLDPEAVAEYEKKCLTSDVNLAEVASVHQILSLLGQRVKVPAEVRTRMYQLVKGRETLREKPAVKKPPVPEPLTKPIQPWVVPEEPRRKWFERFGPIVAGIALIALSIVTASWSLSGPQPQSLPPPVAAGEAAAGGAIASDPSRRAAGVAMPDGPEELDPIGAEDVHAIDAGKSTRTGGDAAAAHKVIEPSEAKVAKAAESASASKDAAAPRTVPLGTLGTADASGGILLRYNPDQREWERLTAPTPLSRDDRLLCLSPFLAMVKLGQVPITLVGETEVRVLAQSADKVPVLELVQGRLLLRNPPSGSFKVVFSDRTATLTIPSASTVVLERMDRREYGRTVTQAAPLVVYCVLGEAALSTGAKQESLTASDVVVIDTAGAIRRAAIDTPPSWATDAEPSPEERRSRQEFNKVFHPGRPVLTDIVTATEDENLETKRLAIVALKSLGDLSLLMPILSRRDDPVARRNALAAIRTYMGLGPDAANRVRGQLAEEFGDDTASFVEKMLIGYTPDEASKSQLYERLVAALGPEQAAVGVRELAVDTLKSLTGRDDLGYDPDHPEGKGLSSWKELLRQGKLRYSAARAKAK
jgi:hypothetical protein